MLIQIIIFVLSFSMPSLSSSLFLEVNVLVVAIDFDVFYVVVSIVVVFVAAVLSCFCC